MEKRMGIVIKEIVQMRDEEIFKNPARFHAYIDDLASELKTEKKIFRRAVNDEIIGEIYNLYRYDKNEGKIELLRIKKKLEDEYGFSEKWSRYVISEFAEGFGIEEVSVSQEVENIGGSPVLEAPKRENSGQTERNEEIPKVTVENTGNQNPVIKEIEPDNEKINAIIEEAVMQAARPKFEIITTRVFSTSYTDGTEDDRIYAYEFPKNQARYIGIQLKFEPVSFLRTPRVNWQVFCENGKVYSELIKRNFTVEPGSGSIWLQWGYSEPGRWKAGRYKFVVNLGRETVTEFFEIQGEEKDSSKKTGGFFSWLLQ